MRDEAQSSSSSRAEATEASTTTVYVASAVTDGADIGDLRRVDVDVCVAVGAAVIEGNISKALADTGSGVTLIPMSIFKSMRRTSGPPGAYKLRAAGITIRAANGMSWPARPAGYPEPSNHSW